jgi:trans-aconitate methyltransferase
MLGEKMKKNMFILIIYLLSTTSIYCNSFAEEEHLRNDYSALFQFYLKNTNEKQLTHQYLLQIINQLNKREFFADIGAGDGSLSFKLTKFFQHSFLIEQNPEFANILRTQPTSNIHVIEEDVLKTSLDQKMDLILASHLLYFFEKPLDVLHHLMTQLDEQGFLAVVLLQPLYKDLLNSTEYEDSLYYNDGAIVKKKNLFHLMDIESIVNSLDQEKYKAIHIPFNSTVSAENVETLFMIYFQFMLDLKPQYRYCNDEQTELHPETLKFIREKFNENLVKYNEKTKRYEFQIKDSIYIIQHKATAVEIEPSTITELVDNN